MEMFDKARFDLERVKSDYFKKAKEYAMASEWNEDFKDLPEVRQLRDVIVFFQKHDLIEQDRLEEQSKRLEQFINDVQENAL